MADSTHTQTPSPATSANKPMAGNSPSPAPSLSSTSVVPSAAKDLERDQTDDNLNVRHHQLSTISSLYRHGILDIRPALAPQLQAHMANPINGCRNSGHITPQDLVRNMAHHGPSSRMPGMAATLTLVSGTRQQGTNRLGRFVLSL
ncbi:hypothetical protein BGZ58_001467 [Dissophora ornata]|nr:hypothetical protein BGZ58_001467 [Dissophora ornata]